MSNFFKTIATKQDAWFSETIGEQIGYPVAVRVMNDVAAPFHTHEITDDMFIVLTGTAFIDTVTGTNTINKGQSHTVFAGAGAGAGAGAEHRARVVGRAELIVIGGQNA